MNNILYLLLFPALCYKYIFYQEQNKIIKSKTKLYNKVTLENIEIEQFDKVKNLVSPTKQLWLKVELGNILCKKLLIYGLRTNLQKN